ncbi:sulfatase [Thalassotalea agarivorans]|uniref:Arylsulfatase A n=1 Tax=Thalassotalea agarivorans TaxID=349064 RepID=A0A1I0GZ39_THASX|nr:sulfatase [Thalassotalea agarivorans]SET75630.1 Arylsulfatase A [Thalassotalea agarivorans]
MNKIFIFFTVCLLLLGSAGADAQEKQSKEQPNFVFIAIDDLNDWLGYMGGHPQAMTPNIDALAQQGSAFTNAHSVSPGCSPSRNALLYGVEPFNSGLYPFYEHDIHKQLKEKYVSLPQFLKENGYNTFGAGKIHHGPEKGEVEWTDYLEVEKFAKTFAEGKGFHDNSKSSFRPVTNPFEQLPDYQVTSYGVDIVSKKHDKPFFAAIGIVKPHLPFDCPVQFYDALPDAIEAPAMLANDLDDIGPEGNSMRRVGDDNKFRKNKQWESVRRAYLSCISWVDHNVGRLMKAIAEGPNADNTVVVLWSDHGFHLGEKRTFRKFTLWEEASRVPFIIYDSRKANQAQQNVNQAVTLINVYRTLADYAGLQAPEYVDGFSLLPQLNDPEAPMAKPAISTWGRGNYSVRTKGWRLIRYFDGFIELYHNQQDPNEWHNVAGDPKYQSKKQELLALLPAHEAPIVEEYIADWSLYGADKARLKKSGKKDGNKKDKKKEKKKKNKNKQN